MDQPRPKIPLNDRALDKFTVVFAAAPNGEIAVRPAGVALVVEDDWLLRQNLVDDLTAEGWTVLEAESGESALAAMSEDLGIGLLVTDIRLGGAECDPQLRDRVVAAGGLLVIGTEHHEHRRLDAQLRGRAGRQGDPGRSVFHASLEDDLLKNAQGVLVVCPTGSWDPAAARDRVMAAQRRIETRNFNSRLNLLRFEEVIEKQRDLLYRQRKAIRDEPEPLAIVNGLRDDSIDDLIGLFAPASGKWDIASLDAMIRSILTLAVPISAPSHNQVADSRILRERISTMADSWMQAKIESIGRVTINNVLRRILMAMLDELWVEQLERLEHLKRMIADRRLPLDKQFIEFHMEAFTLFQMMTREFRHEVTAHAMRLGKV